LSTEAAKASPTRHATAISEVTRATIRPVRLGLRGGGGVAAGHCGAAAAGHCEASGPYERCTIWLNWASSRSGDAGSSGDTPGTVPYFLEINERAKNERFAGLSAKRRIRYPYHCVP